MLKIECLSAEISYNCCRFMFDAKNGMFIPLEENGPGLQPNPFPPNHIKLKHYRLAGKYLV